jgi:hypothetical protein
MGLTMEFCRFAAALTRAEGPEIRDVAVQALAHTLHQNPGARGA